MNDGMIIWDNMSGIFCNIMIIVHWENMDSDYHYPLSSLGWKSMINNHIITI